MGLGNIREGLPMHREPALLTRAGSPNTEASWIHEKHDIVSFFLGDRRSLVLRTASCHAT